MEFLAGTEDLGPGVRLVANRPNLVLRPTVMTMWEGMPIEINFRGRTSDAFDRHRAAILNGARKAFDDEGNWDRQGAAICPRKRYKRGSQAGMMIAARVRWSTITM